MKTIIKLGVAQATWAWIGIILFFILGIGKLKSNPINSETKSGYERKML